MFFFHVQALQQRRAYEPSAKYGRRAEKKTSKHAQQGNSSLDWLGRKIRPVSALTESSNSNFVVIRADPWQHELAERMLLWINYKLSLDPRPPPSPSKVSLRGIHTPFCDDALFLIATYCFVIVKQQRRGIRTQKSFNVVQAPIDVISADWLQEHPDDLTAFMLHNRILNATLPITMVQRRSVCTS